MHFRKDDEQRLEASQASESEAAPGHVDESKPSEISEHEYVGLPTRKRAQESQTAKKPPKQILSRRSDPRKRPPNPMTSEAGVGKDHDNQR